MQSDSPIHAFGMTDTGKRRPSNEDAYFIDTSCNCFVVSDGVGGASAGEVASAMFIAAAAKIMHNKKPATEQDVIADIKNIFFQANSAIYQLANNNPDCKGMACTAELLSFGSGSFILGHVGDSRTYRYRQGKLVKLTKDHSLVQQQIDQGNLTENDAKTHRLRNVILRAIGNGPSIDVDIIRGKVRQGDLFLLCSDGLTDMVAEPDIASCLESTITIKQKVSSLVNLANQAGGRDNITIILASVGQ